MTDQNKHLEDLKEIRNLMEKSSRFISLSGLSGVAAGIIAIIGTILGYLRLNSHWTSNTSSRVSKYVEVDDWLFNLPMDLGLDFDTIFDLVLIAAGVLIAALLIAIAFTTRNAKKNGQKIWGKTTQLLLINTAIPLAAGGIFCAGLLFHGLVALIAPATLIFYGLACINGSKHTLRDIRYLGISEIILGLLATFFAGHGLLFWALGFGVLHIVYGAIMYFRYERK